MHIASLSYGQILRGREEGGACNINRDCQTPDLLCQSHDPIPRLVNAIVKERGRREEKNGERGRKKNGDFFCRCRLSDPSPLEARLTSLDHSFDALREIRYGTLVDTGGRGPHETVTPRARSRLHQPALLAGGRCSITDRPAPYDGSLLTDATSAAAAAGANRPTLRHLWHVRQHLCRQNHVKIYPEATYINGFHSQTVLWIREGIPRCSPKILDVSFLSRGTGKLPGRASSSNGSSIGAIVLAATQKVPKVFRRVNVMIIIIINE